MSASSVASCGARAGMTRLISSSLMTSHHGPFIAVGRLLVRMISNDHLRYEVGLPRLGRDLPVGASGLATGRRVTITGLGLWSMGALLTASTPMPMSPPSKIL